MQVGARGMSTVTLTVFLLAEMAHATAFQLREGSATAIGTALAGRTANTRDVSLTIQNPALLAGVKGFEVSTGIGGIFPSSDATATLPDGTTGSADPNEAAFVPSLALGWRVNPAVVLGFAVKSPFGLATEYPDSFPTAIDGTRSELTTISATPQIAWTPTPGFTLGAGVTLQYADASLQSFNPAVGRIEVAGDGVDIGYTLGFLAQPAPGTSIGVAFQSGFSHKLEGDQTIPAIGLRANASASFDLPAILSIGVVQAITPGFRVMAEAEWTGWSAFDRITIRNTDTGALIDDDQQGYDNSLMVALGAEYDVSERLTVRAGAAFDETPTSAPLRSQRTPDSNRYWLAAGASYDVTERIGVDAAYLLILGKDVTIQDAESRIPGSRVELSNGRVHLFQLNLRYRF